MVPNWLEVWYRTGWKYGTKRKYGTKLTSDIFMIRNFMRAQQANYCDSLMMPFFKYDFAQNIK